MWHRQRKMIAVFCVIVLITLLTAILISYSKKNDFAYSDQIEAYKRARTIEIYTVEDYLEFANTFTEPYNYAQWTIELCEDLDFSGYEAVPVIGETSMDEETMTFSGTFEGNGHKITNLHISNPEGRAGMFASLGGIVKNLRLENCSFEGKLCGSIAAECYDSAVLNCYVDAKIQGEIAGAIIGDLRGDLYNCVSVTEPVGDYKYGSIDQCYLLGTEDLEALNANLYHLNGYYHDAYFHKWERTEDGILSTQRMELLDTLTAYLMIDGKEMKFQGYYSDRDKQWYIALPATYGDEELYLEANMSNGGYESFKRSYGEEAILFTWGEYQYPIRFIVADNIDSIYITLEKYKNLDYVHANKIEEIPGVMTLIDCEGKTSYETVKGFYGHGNSSWEAAKKSYNIKFDSYVELLDLEANDDFALLAGYRMNSLMSYVANAELTKEVGFDYAPGYRMVNLFVGGEYAGVYYLTEKIELDTNRIEIDSVYEETREVNRNALEGFEYCMWENADTEQKMYYYDIPQNPEDITGGYLLELDVADYGPADSRFTPIGKTNKIILKRAQYSSKEQVEYIAGYWQDFENALLSPNGYNEKGKRYTEYIDLESFAMQWLMYEVSMEDSLKSSVYYYKESDTSGDGKIHACYPWDLERSFQDLDRADKFGSVNLMGTYWEAFYQHEDFRKELASVWHEKFVPAIEYMTLEDGVENEKGVKNLRWHLERLLEINSLEKSRWHTADMEEKCEDIREMLLIRNDVITSALIVNE